MNKNKKNNENIDLVTLVGDLCITPVWFCWTVEFEDIKTFEWLSGKQIKDKFKWMDWYFWYKNLPDDYIFPAWIYEAFKNPLIPEIWWRDEPLMITILFEWVIYEIKWYDSDELTVIIKNKNVLISELIEKKNKLDTIINLLTKKNN